jgi:preprotein translocase subunit SecA
MMEYLRSSVNLRAYGQRDPLIEYKKDGLRFFKEMEHSAARQVAELVAKINIEAVHDLKQEQVRLTENNPTVNQADPKPVSRKPEVGRNDPCPCGSGKKYKKCHGKDL